MGSNPTLSARRIYTPNFFRGRQGYTPEIIVIHIMAGTMKGTIAWFSTPKSKASAHFGVSRFGELVQWVDPADTAYHAGKIVRPTFSMKMKPTRTGATCINPNYYSIGIEHEGYAPEPWSEAMLAKSAALSAQLAKTYKIPVDDEHIVMHHRINAWHTCPGPGFELDRYLERVVQFS